MGTEGKEHLDTHADLSTEIARLKAFVAPLEKEVKVTPIMKMVDTVMLLPDDLEGKSQKDIKRIERVVADAQRVLNRMSHKYINQTLSSPDESRVFKILASANEFEAHLRSQLGNTIDLDGEEVVLTPKLLDCLTQFKFSIGTPPITPHGIKTIEKIMFGGTVQDIYAFRDLFSDHQHVFDRFVESAHRLVDQSTRYTTKKDKEEYEEAASGFEGLEGLTGFTKTVFSGRPETAISIIHSHLLDRHGQNGSRPIKVVEEGQKLNKAFIREMRDNKRYFYVVKVKEVDYNVFTNEVLKEEWESVIGRLIMIDDSDSARRSETTAVYSFDGDITSNLSVFHVKNAGTPANTQMNLRRMLEDFDPEDLEGLIGEIDTSIARLEAEGYTEINGTEVRDSEWKVSAHKDYITLQSFKRFVEFVKKMKTESPEELDKYKKELAAKAAELNRQYFFKALDPEKYTVIPVPQGGGRMGLYHTGRFHLRKVQGSVGDLSEPQFDGEEGSSRIAICRARISKMKKALGIEPDTTPEEASARRRALKSIESPNQPIRGEVKGTSRIAAATEHAVKETVYSAAKLEEKVAQRLIDGLDTILGANVPGLIKKQIAKTLKKLGVKALAKQFERGPFKFVARKIDQAAGGIRRSLVAVDKMAQLPAELTRLFLEAEDFTFVEEIIQSIEKGSFKPSVIVPDMSWTYTDVLDKEDYPKGNHIEIKVNAQGNMDLAGLEADLKRKREILMGFPEIADVYFKSILFVVNDPQNPTGKVLRDEEKLKILDIASEYGLTIVADEAYKCQVDTEIKEAQGYPSFAEFYERKRTNFPNHVTIHCVVPTTKWAMRAGGRTGVVVTNDKSENNKGETLEEYIERNTTSIHAMSLYMDIETLETGLTVKSVCNRLRPTIATGDAREVIDNMLENEFLDIEKVSSPVYLALLKARNDLDFYTIRQASGHDEAKYISNFIDDLTGLRLEKLTQRDTAERKKAALKAIGRLDREIEGISDRTIVPEGPFYVCVQLDKTGKDEKALLKFLNRIAEERGIGLVPQAGGFVRISFGGTVDGTENGYELLGLKVETDLRILFKYWNDFQKNRQDLTKAGDAKPIHNALNSIFPDSESNTVAALKEKGAFVEASVDHYLETYFPEIIAKEEKRREAAGIEDPITLADKFALLNEVKDAQVRAREGGMPVQPFPEGLSDYLTRIEPHSLGTMVTIRAADCKSPQDFIETTDFGRLFNYFLLEIKNQIPELKQMTDEEIIAEYGSHVFVDMFKRRGRNKDIHSRIVVAIANELFADHTIKILALDLQARVPELKLSRSEAVQQKINEHVRKTLENFSTEKGGDILRGATRKVEEYLQSFIQAFTTEEDEEKIKYKPAFQAGYASMDGLKGNSSLPGWAQSLIGKSEFAGESVATDPCPDMVTGGAARVAGHDRMIARRDGDGKDAPDKDYFSNRLGSFVETMNPKDYICKMVQIGPVRTMLVMHRSYAHYIAEELRLMPQFDVSLDDIDSLNPDSVSFLGIPEKVMGENYKVGYYFDQKDDGSLLPVSWVDRENITDYMGYLKKPLLTVANEKIEAEGGMSVHGSALTIKFKNGLRKTAVLAGDSGAGKSETIIAMMEQIFEEYGGAAEVESVDLLAGDMLSIFEGDKGPDGEDGELYMFGTESGDFMRMTDISEGWKGRVRDKLNRASNTNLDHATNPRTTPGGLCDDNTFLKPVRINMFSVIDNFDTPKGPAFQEVEAPETLMTKDYPRGYRKEKGTSGDQPNIYASLKYSKNSRGPALIQKHQEEFDDLLGWDVIIGKNGKAKNANLRFRDVSGKAKDAHGMVKEIFEGQSFERDGESYKITGTKYDVESGQYRAVLKGPDGKEEMPLDRKIFDKIFTPIVSTYCGHPFINPKGRHKILSRFGKIMTNLSKSGNFKTGKIYTQLAVDGQQFSGPASASQDAIKFYQRDRDTNERFQRHKETVSQALIERYGSRLFGEGDIPPEIEEYNLFLLEMQSSENAHLLTEDGKTANIRTPHFTNKPVDRRQKFKFEPSLAIPEISSAIRAICNDPSNNRHVRRGAKINTGKYGDIKFANKAELVFQILIRNGSMKLDYPVSALYKNIRKVKHAEQIANKVMQG
jgi:hypothetical protein